MARVAPDTVRNAEQDPDAAQDYGGAGLSADEYARIRSVLGRRPTGTELAMYGVMWSEHCSYKSSKVHLRRFSATLTDEMRAKMVAGIGAQAGAAPVGDGLAATFKIESHNSPSYLEPYHGAATGVGGVVRDILAMGARPVAVMDQLRVGPVDAADTARVLPAAVAGIADYSAALGVPNIGGETHFDASYAEHPLVNAGCIGLLKVEDIHAAEATGLGNKIVLFGGPTGLDGVGGAAMASASLGADAGDHDAVAVGKPRIPVGDPQLEKRLVAATLEAFDAGLVLGIQDLGAAGIACATSELAAAGDGGMAVRLDDVPLAEPDMSATEIFCSESQERMCAVVRPDDVERFLAVCARHEVPVVVIGEVTDTGRLVVSHAGEVVVDVPPRSVAADGPVYERPFARPAAADALAADTTASLPRPAVDELPALIRTLAADPNLASKSWVVGSYGLPTEGAAAADPLTGAAADAGMVRLSADSPRGIAFSADCNHFYTTLDPYAGTQAALAEAYRNVAATGAMPLAVTNCLNFGSPEDPAVMWQFERAVHGLADGCAALTIPVTGGNVSFYNQSGDEPIRPTPVVGVLGTIDDVAHRLTPVMGRGPLPEMLFLLGETREELDGSAWARIVHGHLGGIPPVVDLGAEAALADLMVDAARDGLVVAAHDLSEGGLAQALVEMCVLSDSGAAITLPPPDAFTVLFSESTARMLVSVPVPQLAAFSDLCETRGVPSSALGSVTPQRKILEISGVGELALADLAAAHAGPMAGRFGAADAAGR